MDTDVIWYVKGRILYCLDVITADDMLTRNQNVLRLLETEGQAPNVHLLIDYKSTNYGNYATNLQKLMRRAESSAEFEQTRDAITRNPLFGWVIAIGIQNKNVEVGGKLLAMKKNYRRKEVESLEQAIAFLINLEPDLEELLLGHTDD